MKRIYLHAGYHKTGTTSLQIALTRGREALARRGLLYPETGRPASARFGQHELAWTLMRRGHYIPAGYAAGTDLGAGSADRLFTALRAEIDAFEGEGVILSSEEFDCLDVAEIADLGRRLEGYDVTPVLFLRGFAGFIEAAYKTGVVHGAMTMPIEEFAESQRSRLDLAQALRDWQVIAGSGGVQLVDYDDPSVRIESLAAFLACLGLTVPGLRPTETRWNQSYSSGLVELTRQLRLCGVAEPQIKAWLKRAPAVVAADRSHSLLGADLRRRLEARYRDELGELGMSGVHLFGAFVAPDGSAETAGPSKDTKQALTSAILSLW